MNKAYLVTLVIILFLSYLYDKTKIPFQKKVLVFLILLSLLLISGLRVDSTLHSDEQNYRYLFQTFEGVNFSALKLSFFDEPGFRLLNWGLANLTHDPQSLIFICALITNLSFILFIYKYSEYFTFSLFLYITSGMFFSSMNIMRQYLAMAIILFGFKYVISKDIKKFCIYVVIGFLFHKSAIIALFFYFVLNSSILDKHKLFSFFIIILVMVSFQSILDLFANSAYGNYVEDFAEKGYGTGIIRIIFFSILYFIVLWKEKMLISKLNIERIFFNATFVSWAIILLSGIYVYVARLDYFNCCTLLLIPTIPYCFKQKDRKLVKSSIYILFFIFGWYSTLNLTIYNLLNIF